MYQLKVAVVDLMNKFLLDPKFTRFLRYKGDVKFDDIY